MVSCVVVAADEEIAGEEGSCDLDFGLAVAAWAGAGFGVAWEVGMEAGPEDVALELELGASEGLERDPGIALEAGGFFGGQDGVHGMGQSVSQRRRQRYSPNR